MVTKISHLRVWSFTERSAFYRKKIQVQKIQTKKKCFKLSHKWHVFQARLHWAAHEPQSTDQAFEQSTSCLLCDISACLTPNTNKLVKWPNRVSRRLREPFTLHSHRLSVFAKHSLGQVTHLSLLGGNSDTCHSAGRIQPNILSGVPFLVVGTWGAEWADINGGGSWRLHSKTKGWRTADRRRACHTLESCAHKVVRWCRQTPRHAED